VLLRNRRITGVDWGAWAMKNPDLNNANLAKVLELIENGKLCPVEPVIYALQDAARALTDIQARKIAGKVALIP
jgi:NADPH2:quinone reductase